MIKAIIFDLDGTLANSSADLTTAINLMRQDYGLKPHSLETVMGFVGDGVRKLVERSLVGDKIDFTAAFRAFNDYYAQCLTDQTTFYPGVLDLLNLLRNLKLNLAVVTNKNFAPATQVLSELGLADYFDIIVGGDSYEYLKPHPCQILKVAEFWKLRPAEIMMVGDHSTDIESANRAGVSSVFIKNGFGKLNHIKPDYQIETVADLADLFQN